MAKNGEREVRLGYLIVRTKELVGWVRSQDD